MAGSRPVVVDDLVGEVPVAAPDHGLDHRAERGEQDDTGIGIASLVKSEERSDDRVLLGRGPPADVEDRGWSLPAKCWLNGPAFEEASPTVVSVEMVEMIVDLSGEVAWHGADEAPRV